MKTKPLLAVTLVTLLIAAGAGYRFWQAERAGALDIQTVSAARGDVRRVVATSGSVRALVTVEVGSQLSGQISEVNADFSSEVKAGQVLARIEPSTFETKVREAQAAVAIAQATLALQEATVQRAQANLRKAERDFERSEELAQRGSASTASLDAARAAKEAAEADLAIARAQVENAKATLVQKQASLESARIDLERTYIRSPIDGVVIERAVEAGQTVAASMTAPKLFTIAQDLTRVQIDAQVDEADIGQVAAGNPATFTVDAYPDVTFEGTVETIRLAPTNLQNVVTYTVVLNADNPMGRLLPGMTANVEIITGARENVLTVPNEALRFQPRGSAAALIDAAAEAEAGTGGAVAARERLLERLRSEAGLSPQEIARARAAIESELADLSRRSGADPFGRSHQGAQIRSRIAKALRTVLTPEQFRRYEEMQRRTGTMPCRQTVWTLENGKLVRRTIRTGLSDAILTEVVDGLEEGARVVTRVRERGSS